MADRVGQLLGSYRLIRLLGRGGSAEVYLAEHQRLNTQAAIKVLHTSLEDDDVEGFLREAQMVAHLRHSHIVRVLDFDVENHTPFLVMDYLANGNIRRSYPKGTILPLPTIVSYVAQVASALQYAHDEKLIHRDIKPENMLLDRDNTLVLSDFGIALMSQSSHFQSTQEVAGTAAYMAPEQFQGHPRRASDQYALAVVVYEWLTGKHPFHGSFSEIASQHLFVSPPSLHKRVPTIPLEVEQVVLTALAKDPVARFASVQAFATALQAAANLSPLDMRSDGISSISDAGTTSSVTALPEDEASLSNQTKGQVVPMLPPQAVVRTLEASVQHQSSETPAPPPFHAEVKATLPAFSETKRPSSITFPPDGRSVSPPSLSVSQRKKSLPAIYVAIGGVIVLLVMASSSLFHFINIHTDNSFATATANTGATATSQAVATTTTLQQIYNQATSGTPAMNDPLSDDRNRWGVFTTNWGGQCAFTGGAYHLSLSKPGYIIVCVGGAMGVLTSSANFALQVQISIVQGDIGGFYFGDSKSGAYGVLVSSSGTYTLYQYTRSDDKFHTLLSTSNPAIRTGLNQVNVFTAIVNNSHLYLYANAQLITSVYLSAYNQGGGGFIVESPNQATDVAFSNLKIWTF